MSIFIANLAFAGQEILINSAKTGIIIGSLVAGVSGYLLLRIFTKENKSNKNKNPAN